MLSPSDASQSRPGNPQVAWSSSGKERYCFESPALCMVFNGGELSLVEYGYVMYRLYTRP